MLNDHTVSNGSQPITAPATDAVRVWPWDTSSAFAPAPSAQIPESDHTRDEAINYILTDCFVSLGQGVKDRKAIDQSAIMWLHDRYRAKFLRTMKTFGNTWMQDRSRVKGVSRMLGERAADCAADKPTIDLASIMQASLAVEKYCRIHAARRDRAMGWTASADGGDAPARHAGYWCEV